MDLATIQAMTVANIAQFMEGIQRDEIGRAPRKENISIKRFPKKNIELYKWTTEKSPDVV